MKLKRITAVLLAAVLVLSGLAFGALDSFALTVSLTDALLNKDITKDTSGYDDNVWYVYTPSESGIYTLYGLSSNLKATEAYLFSKTEDENGKKLYTQLAYSNGNPDYARYEGSARRQFCLKYHLNAGETYYYAAGWNDPTITAQTNRSLGVRLICESYDTASVVRVTPQCDAALTWYTDGSWEQGTDGQNYFRYNISKIIQNMSVTVEFDDGTVLTSEKGETTVNGYPITFSHRQEEVHWYNKENEAYTANTLTVTVLGVSADYEVEIEQGALFTVKGKVTDAVSGEAVAGAQIEIGGNPVSTTASDGTFSLLSAPGTYQAAVTGAYTVKRSFTVTVDAMSAENDHTATPIKVYNTDYVDDNIINGRDLAYIKRNLTGDALTKAKTAFTRSVGFTSGDYPPLAL